MRLQLVLIQADNQSLSPTLRRSSGGRLTRWFIREQIGWGLRKRYQVPKKLPPKLLALVRKLIAIEGNYGLRYARLW
jgi:hypothetical protein